MVQCMLFLVMQSEYLPQVILNKTFHIFKTILQMTGILNPQTVIWVFYNLTVM